MKKIINNILFGFYTILFIFVTYIIVVSLLTTFSSFLLFPVLWCIYDFYYAFSISSLGLILFLILLIIYGFILIKIMNK